jgi:Tol biopolymer transport system component
LKRVPIEGGPPQNICTVPNAVIDASWSTQNVILIGQNQGPLLRVPAGGGTPVPEGELNASRAEVALRFPDFLPDGHHYLFHAMSSDYRSSVFVGDLGSKERIELPGIQSQAKYSTTGHILFIRDLTLYAQPFDADRMQMKGDAFPVAEQVTSNPSGGSAAFSVSRNGGIAYRTTGSSTSGSQLAFFDRSGKQLGLAGPPDEYLNPELSPDCKFVAFNRGRPNDVWILDLEKNLPSRLRTKPDTRTRPLWGRNGRMIMFLGQAAGAGALLQSAFGMLSEESLIKKSNMAESMRIRLLDWSQDGQYLLYSEGSGSQSDLWVMPLMGDKKPFRIMDFQGLRTTITARISPDGHWLAINGYDTGRSEVYVQSFPKPEKRWPVSGSGGTMPRWRRDGKELFFVGDDQMLMSAAIQQQGTTIKTDIPKPLFKLNIIHAQGNPAFYEQYDVTQDNRFLVNSPPEQQSAVPITVILNWAAGLKK